MSQKIDLTREQMKAQAREVLEIEAKAINKVKSAVTDSFIEIIEEIISCSGRVIMTGMGKSGIIAEKLAATLSSTGTPSFFLHPAEAIHGDLGMVTEEDIVIALSDSGETEEVVDILPHLKRIGAKLISITGNKNSTLAKNSNHTLETEVEEEACPLDLAPTASVTATLALGDALAMVLLAARDFTSEDFARYHPGGSLGRRLLLTVDDVLHVRESNPVVREDVSLKEALFKMTSSRKGAVSIADKDGKLVGIIVDGDIRRLVEEGEDLADKKACEVMTKDPIAVGPDKLAAEAVKIMEDKDINDLPIVDSKGQPVGLINFQDLIKAGVF